MPASAKVDISDKCNSNILSSSTLDSMPFEKKNIHKQTQEKTSIHLSKYVSMTTTWQPPVRQKTRAEGHIRHQQIDMLLNKQKQGQIHSNNQAASHTYYNTTKG
jgi:hypothetical protein